MASAGAPRGGRSSRPPGDTRPVDPRRASASQGAQPPTGDRTDRSGDAADRAAIGAAAVALGIPLDAGQRDLLQRYLALLRKWNAVYNLTAIRDPGAMRVQHLFDCLAILPALRAVPMVDPATGRGGPHAPGMPVRDLLPAGGVVLDVGSGGGLPGVVLAICAPQVQVYCVDTVGKKTAFLTQVRAELGLANLHAIHARVETLEAPRDLPAPTLIVSRAFASLAAFVSLTRHLIAPGGLWAAMKGQLPQDEVSELPADVRVTATITLTVPDLDAQRHLLLIEG